MRCPYCGLDRDRVLDSRKAESGASVRRRRVCRACHQRFTTFERVEQPALRVRKRDGSVEPFDRAKVETGISRAATNLALEQGALRRAGARVEGRLREGHRGEVRSAEVGEAVLAALRELHPVAYLRFVSVYEGFTATEDFLRELAELEATPEPAAEGSHDGDTPADLPRAPHAGRSAADAPADEPGHAPDEPGPDLDAHEQATHTDRPGHPGP